MPIHDPWHHQAGGALLSHQHHCPLGVSKTLKGTKAATFERQPHIGRHSCHHQDPLPYSSPTSLCPCPCQIMQGVTMLCALLLDVSCAQAHCAHHILVFCASKHTASWSAKNHQHHQQPVPSGYPNPTRYPVFLSLPDPTRFSFRNHQVAGNPKHRVLPDISGKPEVSGTT